jgi:hypothetical protein
MKRYGLGSALALMVLLSGCAAQNRYQPAPIVIESAPLPQPVSASGAELCATLGDGDGIGGTGCPGS